MRETIRTEYVDLPLELRGHAKDFGMYGLALLTALAGACIPAQEVTAAEVTTALSDRQIRSESLDTALDSSSNPDSTDDTDTTTIYGGQDAPREKVTAQ